jgi:peptidoglycan hydrolase-like protein with peptidoglycan-binding domain
MSPQGPSAPSAKAASPVGASRERGARHPRWTVLAGLGLALAAIVIAIVVSDSFGGSRKLSGGVADNASAISLATVTRRPLSSQTQVSATLGYAGEFSVVNQASGTLTALPRVGQVVRSGHVLYEVAEQSVVLFYGDTPAHRALSKGMSGSDVSELNANLVALGYATSEQLDWAPAYFSSETKYALERLQEALDVKQTGYVSLGQAVFLSGPLRITKVMATLGAQVPPGGIVALASSTTRHVLLHLSASEQSAVRKGGRVTITLPDGSTTPGVVSSIGTVASVPAGKKGEGGEEGAPTIEVNVAPSDPSATGHLDQAPVTVSITTASVPNALVVPVDALLALAGGGYAVEVLEGGVHRLVAVTLGLFDDAEGLVQVSGQGLSAGQRVVVPAE